MTFEQSIAYTTKEGNEYIIRFSEFVREYIPENISVPVVSLDLVLVKYEKQNGRAFMNYLAQYVCDYIINNNVIIYYYCDKSDINMRTSRNKSPQEFRHELFNKLYETIQNDSTIRETLIIPDKMYGDHYISLITTMQNKADLECLSSHFEQFKGK